jgi:hypothetical protein
METIISIGTIDDAKTFVSNSGVADWEWGGNASADGFAEWIYRNCSEIDTDDYDTELGDYLWSVGEDVSGYNL